jgi:anti-sigma regulatory factor (Ser/Thr protein kinase)
VLQCYGPLIVTTVDEVRLVVPARPELMRLARVTAAGLAGRLRFAYDEVEDIRLAIDESCYFLTGPAGREGIVDVVFRVSVDRLEVEGSGRGDATPRSPAGGPAPCPTDGPAPCPTDGPAERPTEGHAGGSSEVVLRALVDEHRVGCDDGGAMFRIVKRRRDAPPAGR